MSNSAEQPSRLKPRAHQVAHDELARGRWKVTQRAMLAGRGLLPEAARKEEEAEPINQPYTLVQSPGRDLGVRSSEPKCKQAPQTHRHCP